MSDAAECENGWLAYKDELCIKAYPDLLSYSEAKDLCTYYSASLVAVKEPNMQDLLANYTHDTFDNLWLGGRYDNKSAKFKWEDGEPLSYTNWQEGYPTNNNNDACIELRPRNAKTYSEASGKWADVACLKRNLVLCQKKLHWSLEDAVNEIMRIRKKYQEENDLLREEVTALKEEIGLLSSRVLPIGSIYVEYFGQPSPESLWPSLSWQDVSSEYAGQFFRTIGGKSESWGFTQSGCAPRITQMELLEQPAGEGSFPTLINIPPSGWSEHGYSGDLFPTSPGTNRWYEGLRFHTLDCEVRPENQAIRLWKRIA